MSFFHSHVLESFVRLAVLLGLTALLVLGTPSAMAAEAEAPETSDQYIKITPLNISIIQESRIRGILQVEINLDVPNETLHERALMLYPRLQDAYMLALRFYATNHLKVSHLPNVEQITHVLQTVTNDVLKQPGARVLLSQVMIQRS